MTGTFACPECGAELTVTGATPGREVSCACCEARVEVPYLPRHGVWTRPRFRKRRPAWLITTAWAGVGLLAAVVAILGLSRQVASRGRAERDAALGEILRAADEAERAGRADRALSEVEAALAFLRGRGEESDRVVELAGRRDRLSVREAEARIAASSTLEPAAAVGEILVVQARARQDRALGPLVPAILGALESARRRQVEADLAAARAALDGGRPLDGLALGERAMAVAEKIESAPVARALAAEAEAMMGPPVARLGVIPVQEPGQFTLGSAPAYEATVGPMAVDALRRQGFAPRPPKGPARVVWDRYAPYRINLKVAESQDGLYLQSRSRISQIDATLTLTRGSRQLWHAQVIARTQAPLPDLPAFVAGRLAVSDRREPEYERRFYDDARKAVVDQLGFKLKGLPTVPAD